MLELSASSRGGENVAVSRDSSAGFTLVELMVAVFILTVGLLGVAGVIASTIQRQIRTSSRIVMTTLAESKIEELRAYSMIGAADTSQVAMGGSLDTSEVNHSDVQVSPSGVQFNRRWTVGLGPAGTRAVTVRVTPVNRLGSMLPYLDFNALLLVTR